MNDSFDHFEAELRRMRPREPSLAMRQGVTERLEAHIIHRRRRRWIVALLPLAGLAAACLAALVTDHDADSPRLGAPSIGSPPIASANPFDDSLPSLWVYRQAMCDAPETVDALLARHAGQMRTTVPINAIALSDVRSERQFDQLFGEP